MKIYILIIVAALITISFYSCDNTLDVDDVYANSTYFEISFNGQTYSNQSFSQKGDSFELGSLSSFESTFPEIQTSKYQFQSSVIYINNDSTFKTFKTGAYRLVQKNSEKEKNLDFRLSVLPNDNTTVNLVTFGVNNVTEIRLLTETNSRCNYMLSGILSASYINTKTNVILPVSGKYRVCVTTYK